MWRTGCLFTRGIRQHNQWLRSHSSAHIHLASVKFDSILLCERPCCFSAGQVLRAHHLFHSLPPQTLVCFIFPFLTHVGHRDWVQQPLRFCFLPSAPALNEQIRDGGAARSSAVSQTAAMASREKLCVSTGCNWIWLIQLHIWIYVSYWGFGNCLLRFWGWVYHKESKELNNSNGTLMVATCQPNWKLKLSCCISVLRVSSAHSFWWSFCHADPQTTWEITWFAARLHIHTEAWCQRRSVSLITEGFTQSVGVVIGSNHFSVSDRYNQTPIEWRKARKADRCLPL